PPKPQTSGPQPRELQKSALPLHGLRGPVGVAAVAPAPRTASPARATPAAARPLAARPRAAAALALRVRDLDRDLPAVELPPVELGDRVLRLFRRRHLDEPETARLPGEAVSDHRRRQDIPRLAEELAKPLARCRVRKTTDIQFGRHVNPLDPLPLVVHAPRTGRYVASEARFGRSGRQVQFTRAAGPRKRRSTHPVSGRASGATRRRASTARFDQICGGDGA